MTGFIYFVKMQDGLIKIGSTTKVPDRVKQLKGTLIHVIEGSCFRETALHFLMRESLVSGEKFKDDDRVRAFIAATKVGDYGGLISDVPRVNRWLEPNQLKYKLGVVRPVRQVREALGISQEQLAREAGVAISTAAGADSQIAPNTLSGRIAQYLVGKARDAGCFIDAHHFTGLYAKELTGLLRPVASRADAA